MSKLPSSPKIAWNPNVKLILADVDQTVADDFMPAEPAMVKELTGVLEDGQSLFFVTGSPLSRLKTRLTDSLPPHLRCQVIVSHCSGAEVWGFDDQGNQLPEPFYSLYDECVDDDHKQKWREITAQLIDEFHLKTYVPQPVNDFRSKTGNDPFAVMFEDRGPQITLELVNAYNLDEDQRRQVRAKLPHLEEVIDLREPLNIRAQELLDTAGVAVTPRLAGVFALDMALKGVSKKSSIEHALARPDILNLLGLKPDDLANPQHLEIWGDRFDRDVGTDRHMCEGVDSRVRAIDFRHEDPARFPEGYNIVVWPGKNQLHEAALDYLRARHS